MISIFRNNHTIYFKYVTLTGPFKKNSNIPRQVVDEDPA